MFGIGATEWLLIILVLILLFGAKKIPEIARGLGRSVNEFKKGMSDSGEENQSDKKPEEKPKA